jgi:RNA polymerase sigma-70 factor, ECF subfamily
MCERGGSGPPPPKEDIVTIAATAGMSDATDSTSNHPRTLIGDERPPADATVDLLEQFKGGNDAALDTILRRSIPVLQRWAHRRVPMSSRGMLDTCDLVQDTVIAALRHLDGFEVRRQGALQAYLRQAIRNRVRDLVRRDRCRPARTTLPADLVDDNTSPLEQLIGSENQERYTAALQKLTDRDREAIVGRLELHYSYEELAVVLGTPTPNAARVAVGRAMKRLVEAFTSES